MLDPAAEQAVLDIVANNLEGEIRDAYRTLLEKIRAGESPRDAVASILEGFTGEFAVILAAGFKAILGKSIGTQSVLGMKVGGIPLSTRLYREASTVSKVVQGIVSRHAAGWQDARKLTLAIYEGYGFTADDPLKYNWRNPKLPKYLRSELLRDPGTAGQLARHFARVSATGLKTASLKAGYLEAIDAMEKAAGGELLEQKLRVAFNERMRYFANRIAQTELHRAYAQLQALELMDDADVEYVQWRMSASHPRTDICDYFAGADLYGLGPGVYPKDKAPVAPAHPYCRCVLSPRLDIGLGTKAKKKPGAERAFVASMGDKGGSSVMGSKAKRDEVLKGADPRKVWNAGTKPEYRVKLAGEVK